jgi:malonyl-CoA O-methyltransferase
MASLTLSTKHLVPRDRKQAVRAAFARAADSYDAHVDVQRDVSAELLARLAAQRLAPRRILEIGCGTGSFTRGLAQTFAEAEIRAIDFCPEMLCVARAKLAGLARVSFDAADGEQLEGSPGEWDLIASSAALQWFADLPKAAARFARLLAPQGRLAFALFGPGTFRELAGVLAESWPEAHPAAAAFLDSDQLQALLRAQFSRVEIVEKEYRREYPSLVDLLRKIKHTGVGAGESRGLLSPARLRRIEAEYLAMHGKIVASYQVFYCDAAAR